MSQPVAVIGGVAMTLAGVPVYFACIKYTPACLTTYSSENAFDSSFNLLIFFIIDQKMINENIIGVY